VRDADRVRACSISRIPFHMSETLTIQD
jgi:hypothetical protein